MKICLIILGAGLAMCLWLRQRHGQRLRTPIGILAVATLAVASCVLFFPDTGTQTKAVNRLQEAIGFKLGQAVAAAFPQGGTVLVLHWSGLSRQTDDPSLVRLMTGLRGALDSRRFQLAPVAPAGPLADDEQQEVKTWRLTGLPPQRVKQWFAAQPGAVAVVAFTQLERVRAPSEWTGMPPLFLAAGADESQLAASQAPGFIRAMLTARATPAAPDAAAPLDRLFDQYYELTTFRGADERER